MIGNKSSALSYVIVYFAPKPDVLFQVRDVVDRKQKPSVLKVAVNKQNKRDTFGKF